MHVVIAILHYICIGFRLLSLESVISMFDLFVRKLMLFALGLQVFGAPKSNCLIKIEGI